MSKDVMTTAEEVQAGKDRIAELEAKLAGIKAQQGKPRYLKVSVKGAVSLYGLRRFPITFYLQEWEQILGMAGDIESFIVENVAELKVKEVEN